MAKEHFIPKGTTEPLDFHLQDVEASDETKQDINLAGLTVTLDVLDRNDTAVTLAGAVSIVTAAEGKVRYTPAAATDFDNYETESPWQVRWKVTGVRTFYVPNTEDRDRWIVKP